MRCLFEGGYPAITTVNVAEYAGLSRGAIQHHFHNRDVMVESAIDHLFSECAADFARAFAKLDAAHRTEQRCVPLMWSTLRDRLLPVWTQLLAASRTEAALRRTMQRIEENFHARLCEILSDVWQDADHARSSVSALITAMLGMCFQSVFASGQWRVDDRRLEGFQLNAARGFARAYATEYPQ